MLVFVMYDDRKFTIFEFHETKLGNCDISLHFHYIGNCRITENWTGKNNIY